MVRTRFAPSPTGFLHIGGVRTALFNWLYARRHGGTFVLRIDDTDQQRNVDEALQPILHGFRWLGIDWDEGPEVGGEFGPYYQSERLELYQSAARTLVERGFAYHDYATTDELQAERETAQTEKRRFIYSRSHMAETDVERARFESAGRQGVIRLKMPREGVCRISDIVRGEVVFEWAGEQDHVIQRADGTCLYHLASVVDDQTMQISHVIRAEEHLSNTPRQIFIAQSLGYELPVYAHLPQVAEPGSKNKLSKRKLDKYLKHSEFAKLAAHGGQIADAIGLEIAAETFNPVIVDFYEQVGYLPDALINYLLLLGWSLDDRTEFFSRADMIENFSLERVNRAPASFDPQKLMAFEDHYMQALPLEQKTERTLPYLKKAGLVPNDTVPERLPELSAILDAAGDRLKVAGDVLEFSDFFVPDESLPYDPKAFDKRLRKAPEAAEQLARFRDHLTVTDPFDATTLDAAMQAFVEREGIAVSEIIHAVRVAVTGKAVGFGMFETLAILGKARCVNRIDRALAMLELDPTD